MLRPRRNSAAISRGSAPLWRLVLITGVLGLLALRFGEPLAQILLPIFRMEIAWLGDPFFIDRLYVDRDGPDKVIRIEIGLAHRLVVNGHDVDPDPRGRANASTLIWHVTLPAILVIAVAQSFPARTRASYAWRTLALVPAVLLLWIIDVPLILLASLWGLVFHLLDPHRFSLLSTWARFLQGGGELAVAITLGMLIGALIPCAAASSVAKGEAAESTGDL